MEKNKKYGIKTAQKLVVTGGSVAVGSGFALELLSSACSPLATSILVSAMVAGIGSFALGFKVADNLETYKRR